MCKEKHSIEKFEEEQRRQVPKSKCLLSALWLTQSVGYSEAVGCVELFPRALMKQTQLIDGEREGSGNWE